MAQDSDRVSLADAISALRRELRGAAERAATIDPKERFRITEAEIELTAVAEDAAEAGADIGWWVFKAKAQASIKDSNTHKVRLKLNLGDVEVGSNQRTA